MPGRGDWAPGASFPRRADPPPARGLAPAGVTAYGAGPGRVWT